VRTNPGCGVVDGVAIGAPAAGTESTAGEGAGRKAGRGGWARWLAQTQTGPYLSLRPPPTPAPRL
jgi:hypothetical protein